VAEQFRFDGKLATLIPHHPVFQIPQLEFVRDQNLPTAAMVCAAFSLELYFKCLIRIGRKSFDREHDLSKLFSLIGRRYRSKIKRYWNANSEIVRSYVERTFQDDGSMPPKVDFEYVLSASKDAFVTMRYVYEGGIETNKGWLADTIVEAARNVILDTYPNWERARQIEPHPETTFTNI
jgi:HEPN domain-containing protein